MKDPLEDLIEQAEAAEADKPWNKWPHLWFVITELIALAIVLWVAFYFDLHGHVSRFINGLIG